jgi:hypothetical protein
MDIIVQDSGLNYKWYKSNMCPKMHLFEYELISRPRGITLERCINTKCHITAEVLWYCLTGKVFPDGIVYEDYPNPETLYISCDDNEHVFILHQNKIYDSWWNAYPLTIRDAPAEMIDAIKEYKPFILLRPDTVLYEVTNYECYRPDTHLTTEDIIVNYEKLNDIIRK